jgi:hypothetical protein
MLFTALTRLIIIVAIVFVVILITHEIAGLVHVLLVDSLLLLVHLDDIEDLAL